MYKKFKEFKSRIIVATDLFGRGIDVERVNVVINYDMSDSSDAYLHRVCPLKVRSHFCRLEEQVALAPRVLPFPLFPLSLMEVF